MNTTVSLVNIKKMSLQIFFLWWEILRFTLWATFKYITQYCLLLHILYSHGLFILSQEGCTFWSPSSISPTLHCQWSPMFSVVFKISSISEMKWYLSFSNISFGASLVAQTIVSAYNAGDPGSIPGSGRSSGEGNGNPFQYSCLENPMDWGAQ